MYLYQRLRDLREDRDLTQKAVASILMITTQQYSLYERGEREIPFHHAITLAKFYNVSLESTPLYEINLYFLTILK